MSENKYKLGQVFTPKHLVHEMWSIFKNEIFTYNIDKLTPLKIFEPGAGKGIFYDTFFDVFDKKDYSKYVMNEINEEDDEKQDSVDEILKKISAKPKTIKDRVKNAEALKKFNENFEDDMFGNKKSSASILSLNFVVRTNQLLRGYWMRGSSSARQQNG